MFPILCSYSEERKRVYSIFQLKVNKNFIFRIVMWHTCLVNRGYAVWVIYEYENSTDYISNTC